MSEIPPGCTRHDNPAHVCNCNCQAQAAEIEQLRRAARRQDALLRAKEKWAGFAVDDAKTQATEIERLRAAMGKAAQQFEMLRDRLIGTKWGGIERYARESAVTARAILAPATDQDDAPRPTIGQDGEVLHDGTSPEGDDLPGFDRADFDAMAAAAIRDWAKDEHWDLCDLAVLALRTGWQASNGEEWRHKSEASQKGWHDTTRELSVARAGTVQAKADLRDARTERNELRRQMDEAGQQLARADERVAEAHKRGVAEGRAAEMVDFRAWLQTCKTPNYAADAAGEWVRVRGDHIPAAKDGGKTK